MRNVNINGLEVDEAIKGVLGSLKNFKQGALLENALFTSAYRISPELNHESYQGQVTEMVHRELANQMGKAILEQHKDLIEVTDINEFPGVTNHKLQLLVLPIENLKHIVEYCIRQIPEESLTKIRNI